MGLDRLAPCAVQLAKVIQKPGCDVLCVIDRQIPSELTDQFNEIRSYDKAFDSVVSCFKSQKLNLPVVYSPVPEVTDYHDVRCYQEAAAKSLQRAIKAGFKSPLLLVPESKYFKHAELCTVLGALQELYVPIHEREQLPDKAEQISNLSLLIPNPRAEEILKEALILEAGRFVARDIG